MTSRGSNTCGCETLRDTRRGARDPGASLRIVGHPSVHGKTRGMQFAPRGLEWAGRQMAVVTISRVPGSSGDALARALAERLQYRLVERAELVQLAETVGGADVAWER